MANDQYEDIESVAGELDKPLIDQQAKRVYRDDENGSIWMVLLSTFVAVCGSFEFGTCVGYSSPTQSAIREDLNLSLSQYSVFGSIVTIGAIIGAITSGRIADFIGRKGGMRISAVFCIAGWLAVYFSMEACLLDIGRFCTGYGIGLLSYVVPINVVGVILMDKSRRRPLLMISASGTFVGCFLTAAAFFLKSRALLIDCVLIIAVSGVLVYISAFSIGMGAIPWIIMSEVFPIQVRGLGGSFVALVAWSGAWAVSYTFNFLINWSATGTFMIYAGFCALTVVFVAKIVPETKGKTLEQIQASIN